MRKTDRFVHNNIQDLTHIDPKNINSKKLWSCIHDL